MNIQRDALQSTPHVSSMYRYRGCYWNFYFWHTDMLTLRSELAFKQGTKKYIPLCLTKTTCHEMCGRCMCTHISNMTLHGGAWLASRPGFFVSRNEPRYLLDKWFLPPTAALDIVALKCIIRKEEAHEENSNSSYSFLTSALDVGE
jgi:hypothetical protein